jgi:hypothetical protein
MVMPAAARFLNSGQVALAGVEEGAGLEVLERRVEDLLLHAEVLGDEVDQRDVEALHLAVDLRLEGRVGQVGAGGELAGLDQFDAAGGGLLAAAAVVGGGAAGHEDQPGRRGDGGQGAGPAAEDGVHGWTSW